MKNKILFYLIIPALFILSLNSGCKYDEIVPETVPPGVVVTFSGDILPIFNASCNFSGCHAVGQTPPDLTPNNAYDALFDGGYIDIDNPEQSELYQWVKGNRGTPMPITGTDNKIVSETLAWIEQGALNN